MRTKPASEPYRTRDLHVAAFLLSRDFPLIRLEGSPGQRVFVLQGPTEEDVIAFYKGPILLDARKLLNALRDLRGLLAQGDRR